MPYYHTRLNEFPSSFLLIQFQLSVTLYSTLYHHNFKAQWVSYLPKLFKTSFSSDSGGIFCAETREVNQDNT